MVNSYSQVGLTEILKLLGIEPDGIIGHSVGENACAYADGCLSLEQAVMASYVRGVASTEVPTIKGMMAAIGEPKLNFQPLYSVYIICSQRRRQTFWDLKQKVSHETYW